MNMFFCLITVVLLTIIRRGISVIPGSPVVGDVSVSILYLTDGTGEYIDTANSLITFSQPLTGTDVIEDYKIYLAEDDVGNGAFHLGDVAQVGNASASYSFDNISSNVYTTDNVYVVIFTSNLDGNQLFPASARLFPTTSPPTASVTNMAWTDTSLTEGLVVGPITWSNPIDAYIAEQGITAIAAYRAKSADGNQKVRIGNDIPCSGGTCPTATIDFPEFDFGDPTSQNFPGYTHLLLYTKNKGGLQTTPVFHVIEDTVLNQFCQMPDSPNSFTTFSPSAGSKASNGQTITVTCTQDAHVHAVFPDDCGKRRIFYCRLNELGVEINPLADRLPACALNYFKPTYFHYYLAVHNLPAPVTGGAEFPNPPGMQVAVMATETNQVAAYVNCIDAKLSIKKTPSSYTILKQNEMQTLSLRHSSPVLSAGSFKLKLYVRGLYYTTTPLAYDATPSQMKAAIEEHPKVTFVDITARKISDHILGCTDLSDSGVCSHDSNVACTLDSQCGNENTCIGDGWPDYNSHSTCVSSCSDPGPAFNTQTTCVNSCSDPGAAYQTASACVTSCSNPSHTLVETCDIVGGEIWTVRVWTERTWTDRTWTVPEHFQGPPLNGLFGMDWNITFSYDHGNMAPIEVEEISNEKCSLAECVAFVGPTDKTAFRRFGSGHISNFGAGSAIGTPTNTVEMTLDTCMNMCISAHESQGCVYISFNPATSVGGTSGCSLFTIHGASSCAEFPALKNSSTCESTCSIPEHNDEIICGIHGGIWTTRTWTNRSLTVVGDYADDITYRYYPFAKPHSLIISEAREGSFSPNAMIKNGIVTFGGIALTDIGQGYILQVYSRNLAISVDTQPFEVVLGEAALLHMEIYPGSATGGIPINPQPKLLVVDIGNNPISISVLGGCTMSIGANPSGGTLFPLDKHTVDVVDGKIFFIGMYVDIAGSGYELVFTANFELKSPVFKILDYTVGIGPPSEIRMISGPKMETAGYAFNNQPAVSLHDFAGNKLSFTSDMYVRATLRNNPGKSTLSRLEMQSVELRHDNTCPKIALETPSALTLSGWTTKLNFQCVTARTARIWGSVTAPSYLTETTWGNLIQLPIGSFDGTNTQRVSLFGVSSSDTEVTGFLSSGGTNSVTLPSTFSSVNNFYAGRQITFTIGEGSGQTSTIATYIGETRTVTFEVALSTAVDTTSKFFIKPWTSSLNVNNFDGVVSFDPSGEAARVDPGLYVDMYHELSENSNFCACNSYLGRHMYLWTCPIAGVKAPGGNVASDDFTSTGDSTPTLSAAAVGIVWPDIENPCTTRAKCFADARRHCDKKWTCGGFYQTGTMSSGMGDIFFIAMGVTPSHCEGPSTSVGYETYFKGETLGTNTNYELLKDKHTQHWWHFDESTAPALDAIISSCTDETKSSSGTCVSSCSNSAHNSIETCDNANGEIWTVRTWTVRNSLSLTDIPTGSLSHTESNFNVMGIPGWRGGIDIGQGNSTPGSPSTAAGHAATANVVSQSDYQSAASVWTSRVWTELKWTSRTWIPATLVVAAHCSDPTKLTESLCVPGCSDDTITSITFTGTSSGYKTGTYTAVASTSLGSGTGATFDVTVDSSGDITSCIINDGGKGYQATEILTLLPTTIGYGAGETITISTVQGTAESFCLSTCDDPAMTTLETCASLCSDDIYKTKASCEEDGAFTFETFLSFNKPIWSDGGVATTYGCSDASKTTIRTCVSTCTDTSKLTAATCIGSCSVSVYTTEAVCLASGSTWTSRTWNVRTWTWQNTGTGSQNSAATILHSMSDTGVGWSFDVDSSGKLAFTAYPKAAEANLSLITSTVEESCIDKCATIVPHIADGTTCTNIGACKYSPLYPVYMGTLTSGGLTSAVLPIDSHVDNSFYNGRTIKFLTGAGSGQQAIILTYVSTTRTITFNALSTAPNALTTFEILEVAATCTQSNDSANCANGIGDGTGVACGNAGECQYTHKINGFDYHESTVDINSGNVGHTAKCSISGPTVSLSGNIQCLGSDTKCWITTGTSFAELPIWCRPDVAVINANATVCSVSTCKTLTIDISASGVLSIGTTSASVEDAAYNLNLAGVSFMGVKMIKNPQDGSTTNVLSKLIHNVVDHDYLQTFSDTPFNYNTWYHAAVTYSGEEGTENNLKIYWTEVQQGVPFEANMLASGTLLIDFDSTTSNKLYVGGNPQGTMEFPGVMDELRISNKMRLPTEMLTYWVGLPPLPIPLTAGSFRLKFTHDIGADGVIETETTDLISYSATAEDVKKELELLNNIRKVTVERVDGILYEGPMTDAPVGARFLTNFADTSAVITRSWNVTYITELGDVAEMVPSFIFDGFMGDGSVSGGSDIRFLPCTDCEYFSSSYYVPRLVSLILPGGLRQMETVEAVTGCTDAISCIDKATGFYSDITVEVVGGEAHFKNLVMDKVGVRYTIQLELYTFITGVGYIPDSRYASVKSETTPFDVILGPPTYLEIIRFSGDAWAGGQPFNTQPSIALKDAGKNTIESDSHSRIKLSMIVDPTGGESKLSGSTSIILERGFGNYTDLALSRSGKNYRFLYELDGTNISVDEFLDVDPSSEVQVLQKSPRAFDRFGWSVDIDSVGATPGKIGEDIVAIGAPGVEKSSYEVQRIMTRTSKDKFRREKQSFGTDAIHRNEIQTISTIVDYKAVVSTTITSGGTGFTENSYTSVSSSTTGSGSGATFDVTVNSSGVITTCVINNPGRDYEVSDNIILNTETIGSGSGTKITVATISTPSTVGGFFTLSWKPTENITVGPTRPIAAHASAEQIHAFIMQDLAGIFPVTVKQTAYNKITLEKSWSIEFLSSNSSYVGCVTKGNTGATAPTGSRCAFPFFFNGVRYDHCTKGAAGGTGDENTPWCSIDTEYVGNWGHCDCNIVSDVAELVIDKTTLTGSNVNAQVITTIPSTLMGGTFKLKMRSGPLISPATTSSRDLPWNASAAQVKTAIEEDLLSADFFDNPHAISIHTISRSEATGGTTKSNEICSNTPSGDREFTCTGGSFAASPQGGFEWVFEYNIDGSNYNIPQIEIDNTLMTGYGKMAWSRTWNDGEAPIGGVFDLRFKTEGPTTSIPFDATAQQMQSALQALNTIETVVVERSGPYFAQQYIWTITFTVSNTLSEYGFFSDSTGNLISLNVSYDKKLTGTGAHVNIESVYGDEFHPIYMKSRMGSPGQSAGAVYIMSPTSSETWEQTAKIVADDANSFDFFGYDVSIEHEYLVVGSPGKEDYGSIEEQDISCNADGGWFTLTYTGATTSPIPYNANHTVLAERLRSLYSIADITVESFSSVCNVYGTKRRVKFTTNQFGDLPALQIADSSGLTNAVGSVAISVVQVIQGTAKAHGTSYVQGFQSGAAYVFRRVTDEKDGSPIHVWQQQAKLLPIIPEYPSVMSFGFAVEITGKYVFVSAPHEDDERGAIYVFTRTNSKYEGYCTPNDVATEETCVNSCSDSLYTDSTACTNGGGVWTTRVWSPAASRLLHWSFENGSGTLVDDRSANSRKTPNQRIVGGVSHPSPGVPGTLLANDVSFASTVSGTAVSGDNVSVKLTNSASTIDGYYIGQAITLGSETATITSYNGSTRVAGFDSINNAVTNATSYSISMTDFYVGKTISFVSGTGSGQSTVITAYNASTNTLSFNSISVAPDSSTVYEVYDHIAVTGTLVGGSSTVAILPSSASSVDNFYVSRTIYFLTGKGERQSSVITAYNGASKRCTFNVLTGSPVDMTTTFKISEVINIAGYANTGTTTSMVMNASSLPQWTTKGICGAEDPSTFGGHVKTALYFSQRESSRSEHDQDQMVLGGNDGGNVGENSFSLSIWLKTGKYAVNGEPGITSGYATLIANREAVSPYIGYELRLNNDGQAEFRVKGTGGLEGVATFGAGILDDQWHFLVVTVDRSNNLIQPYIDGHKLDSVSWSGTGSLDGSTPTPFEVGGRQGGGKYLKGYLDDIRIYVGVLVDQEISFLRNACLYPASPETYPRSQRFVASSRSPKDRLGTEMSVYQSPEDLTLACAAAGVDSNGAVQLFKLNQAGSFVSEQQIVPYQGQTRGGFGLALSLHRHTLVVGAPFEKNPTDPSMLQMGAVYVFRRDCYNCVFVQKQKLVPSDGTHGDRFGIRVALNSNTLIVTARAEYLANQLRSQKMVQEITTVASKSQNNAIGGHFIIAWRYSTQQSWNNKCYPGTDIPCHDFEMEFACKKCPGNRTYKKKATYRLPHDIDDKLMKIALQGLSTGNLLVSRSLVDDQGGYTWSVTFLEHTDWIPMFEAVSFLDGEGAGITVKNTIPNLEKSRSGVYVHVRSGANRDFQPQAVLQPKVLQNSDMFGYDIAIDAELAALGAPNRDSHIPGVNSGSSFLYNLEFLNVGFVSPTSTVTEDSGKVTINLKRCDPSCNRSTSLCEDSGGYPFKEACFRLGVKGESCNQTCLSSGGVIAAQVTPDYNTLPTLIGFDVVKRETLGVYECFVPDASEKHIRPINSTGDGSGLIRKDTWKDSSCRLSCPCNFPDAKKNVQYNKEENSIDWDQAFNSCSSLSGHKDLCLADSICPDGKNVAAAGGICSDQTKFNATDCVSSCSDALIATQSSCINYCSDVAKITSGDCVSSCSNPSRNSDEECDINLGEIWTIRTWTLRTWTSRTWTARNQASNRISGIAWAPVGNEYNGWIGVGNDNLCQRYKDIPDVVAPPSAAVVSSWSRKEVFCCSSIYPGNDRGQSLRYYTGDEMSNLVMDSTILSRHFPASRIGTALGELCHIEDKLSERCEWSGNLHEKVTDSLLSSGERSNIHMRGTYDYSATNDYSPDSKLINFGASSTSNSFDIVVTDDHFAEAPDEFFNVRINLPGFIPIFGGQFWHVSTIIDDDDGVIAQKTYSQKMNAADAPVVKPSDAGSPPPINAKSREFDGYGYAVEIIGGHSFASAPFHEKGGRVYIKRRISGIWKETQELSELRCVPFIHKSINFDIFGNSSICTSSYEQQSEYTDLVTYCSSVCSDSPLCTHFYVPLYGNSCCISESDFTDTGNPLHVSATIVPNDAHTLHWWHLDETSGVITDAVAGSSNLPLTGVSILYSRATLLNHNSGTSQSFGNSIDISGGTLFELPEISAGTLNDGHLETSNAVAQSELQSSDGAFTYEAFVKLDGVGKWGSPSAEPNMLFYHDKNPSGNDAGFKLYIDRNGSLIFDPAVSLVEKFNASKCAAVEPHNTISETCTAIGDCAHTPISLGVTGNLQASVIDTAILQSGASTVDDFYNGYYFIVLSGSGYGQVRTIVDYVGGTNRDIVFDTPLTTALGRNDQYKIISDVELRGTLDGTLATGSGTSAVLPLGTSIVSNHYVGKTITFLSGSGANQSALITQYNATTKTVTFESLTAPVNHTTVFGISSKPLYTGTVASSTGLTKVTFPASTASLVTNYYQYRQISFESGLGSGQIVYISAYDASTREATLYPELSTAIDNTTTFSIPEEYEHTGTLLYGTTTTARLPNPTSTVENFYVGRNIIFTSGVASGNTRTITAYDGNTRTVTWESPSLNPTPNGYTKFRIDEAVIIEGFLDGSATTSVTLPASSSSVDDFYKGRIITITGGKTFPLKTGPILNYNGTTKVATVFRLVEIEFDTTTQIQIADIAPTCKPVAILTGLKHSILPPNIDGVVQNIDSTSWYHVAITYNGKEADGTVQETDNLKMYWTKVVNGVGSPAKLIASATMSADLSSTSDTNKLFIGGEPFHNLQVQLDEFCRFTSRLDGGDCINVNFARKDSGIWKCYDTLLETQSNQCVDNTGSIIACKAGSSVAWCDQNTAISNYLDNTGLQIGYRHELSGLIDEVRFSSIARDPHSLLVAQIPPNKGNIYKCRNGNKALFGMSMAADDSNMVPTLVVGAPGVGAAFVYVYDVPGYNTEDEGYRNGQYNGKWLLEGRLEAPEASLRSHSFADEHALGLHGNYAIVGAKGLEKVFLYRRDISTKTWALSQTLQSSDYAEMTITTKTYMLRPEFGTSVDIFENTFVVGAPRQVYGDLSTIQNITYQPPILQGTGAAYIFTATVTSSDLTTNGFCRGTTTGSCTGGPDLLDGQPWCETVHGCTYSNGLCTGTPTACETEVMNKSHSLCVTQPSCRFDPITDYKFAQQTRVTANDAARLDNFGSDIAIDGDTLAIAAFNSNSNPTCTWDFESGELRGWQRSGTAFNNQPTFGDNPMFREVYVKNFVRTFSSRKIYDVEKIQGHKAPYQRAHYFSNFAGYKTAFADSYFVSKSAVVASSTVAGCESSCFESNEDTADECLGFHRNLDRREALHDCYMIMSSFTGNGIESKQVELVETSGMETFVKKPYIERFYSDTDYTFRTTSVSSNVAGKYWIGTYENRHVPSAPKGGIQGDGPVGAMWSPPFMISGDEISFLLGGGCTDHSIYIELMVNHRRVYKNTGWCSETMRRVKWDVHPYIGQSAVIRIVDNGIGAWGHINVDDFKFSWILGGRASDSSDVKGVETSKAGTVYIFRRHSPTDAMDRCDCVCPVASDDACVCGMDRFNCPFSQETRLTASDKRSGDLFGMSLALSDEKNILIVGASHAPATDNNNVMIDQELLPNGEYRSLKEVGAVYLFTRSKSERSADGTLVRYPAWAQHDTNYATSYSATFDATGMTAEQFTTIVMAQLFAYGYVSANNLIEDDITVPNFPFQNAVATERAKIQPIKSVREGHFGWAVAIDEYNLVVGAPSDSHYGPASGSSFFYEMELAAEVLFSSQQTVVKEGVNGGRFGVQLFRLGDLKSELHVHYATSDGTAIGISHARYDACMAKILPSRVGTDCGDFKHDSGEVIFYPGQSVIKLFLNVMNDLCQETQVEEFYLQLNIVGGPTLKSEYFRSVIRIDDDDLGYREC